MGIQKYINQEPELARIQAKVQKTIAKDADNIRSKLGVTWNELVEALLKRLIAEEK